MVRMRERGATYVSRADPLSDFSTPLNHKSWLNGHTPVSLPADTILDSMQPLNVTNSFLLSLENESFEQEERLRAPIAAIAD